MIADTLENLPRYFPLHPGFQVAYDFLRQENISQLEDGKHPIDGEKVFAVMAREKGRGKNDSPLEAHRNYIDIQFTVAGSDCIGWRNIQSCTPDAKGYDSASDLEFFVDAPEFWTSVPAGHFAVFFPEDAHAPLATEGSLQKVVVKVSAGR